MKTRILYIFTIVLFSLALNASHNRAGEITYIQIDDLTIIATITTYTKSSSVQADKDSILLDWGDGTMDFVLRTNNNGNGQELENNVKFNTYIMEHTYPARSTYTMCMIDPNRVANIQNLNFPNSSNLRFSIQTTFTLVNTQFNGTNSSVQLLQPPIDLACVGEVFIHTPNAFDPDQGDSLAFELTMPFEECNVFVEDYVLPDQIIPNNNDFNFDTKTGTIVWDSPQKAGEYNVAFFIHEFRDGVLLNTVLRDMQIFVFSCDNSPPVIEAPDELCVIAGDTVNVEITITDPDLDDLVITDGTGAPFLFDDNPATLSPAGQYLEVPYTVNFQWITDCNDISDNNYNIVIRAADNEFDQNPPEISGLADLHTLAIKVVGPPPEDVDTEILDNAFRLEWNSPYDCEITEDMFFQGFSIWRAEQMIDIPFDTCAPGIEGFGYEEVTFGVTSQENGSYFYIDEEVEKGITYCYRIVAEFAQVSEFGFPFNFVQSLRSEEICAQLPRDIPLLTEVSVLTTDTNSGRISISYIKPDPIQLDTIQNPGPYRYQLQKADGITGDNFVDIANASFISPDFGSTIPLNFIDENLNTQDQGYNYRVAFFANGVNNFFDNSPTSSSVFLGINPQDEVNQLSWEYQTSWVNERFLIFRENDFGVFTLIDSTNENSYDDVGLINGIEYCYFVESQGSYQVADLDFDIFNNSNESCQTPIDTVAPCTPELTVENPCEEANVDTPEEFFTNILMWNRVDITCDASNDISAYNIYVKENVNQVEPELIATITDIQVISFEDVPDSGLTACYAISSVDSTGNESALSDFICVEDCPSYILPNAFTPNGDGDNDVFTPILSRFVTRINFQAFNEWGQKVFETNDPLINWAGDNFGGSQLNDGVYYYTCEVFQTTSAGEQISFNFLKGSIYLLK